MEQSLPISTGIIEIALKEKVRLARESPAYRRGFDNGAGKWFSRTLSLYHEFFIFAGELVWVKGTGPMRGYKKTVKNAISILCTWFRGSWLLRSSFDPP